MSMTHRTALFLLGITLLQTASGRFPVCQFHWELQRAEQECHTQLEQQTLYNNGCHGMWDNITCWQTAALGKVMTQSCPSALLHLFGKNGNISRNCTEKGWSSVYPSITTACWSDNSDEPNKCFPQLSAARTALRGQGD
ncbi:vasoactive intestinal polypeptide receptor 2-like [Polymixia lowei]